MSSYFDSAANSATFKTAKRIHQCNPMFQVQVVERTVVEECVLIAGDREFPDALRQRIMGVVALHASEEWYGLPPREATIRRINRCEHSILIEELHDIFHDVARATNIKPRFGRLSDNPRDMLNRREEYDNELAGEMRHHHE